MRKLTKVQRKVLDTLNKDGFVEHKSSFGGSQPNRPAWALVQLELAKFGWGPEDSFLKTQGFLPTEAGKNFKE